MAPLGVVESAAPPSGPEGSASTPLVVLWSTLEGPTAAIRTLSAMRVTTATESSSSKTIDPTSPSDIDCAVTYEEGWLAGFTPVRLPLEAVLA